MLNFTPSRAGLWLNCPYSSRFLSSCYYKFDYDNLDFDFNCILNSNIYDKYTKLGIICHHISSLKLKKQFNIINKIEYDTEIEKIINNKLYNKNIEFESNYYIDTINKIIERLREQNKNIKNVYVEKYLECYISNSKMSGIADFIAATNDELLIFELKAGEGVIVNNFSQLLLYAILYIFNYKTIFKKINLIIVQPSSSEKVKINIVDDVDYYIKKLNDIILKIEFGDTSKKYGNWCSDFKCPNFSKCEARFNKINVNISNDIDKIDNLELENLYITLQDLKNCIESLENEVEERIINNEHFAKLDLTRGKKHRTLTNPIEAVERLRSCGFRRR